MTSESTTKLIAAEHRDARSEARQRALSRTLIEPYTDRKKLFAAVRGYLLQCTHTDALQSSMRDVMEHVHFSESAGSIHVGSKHDPAKNFRRDSALPHLVRRDGAWFDFSFVLGMRDKQVEVLGYNAEIRFPDGVAPTQARWLRFDLNLDGHVNDDERSMRAHMHAGNDDWLIPAPALRPFELLDLLVFGLALPDGRKPRDAT